MHCEKDPALLGQLMEDSNRLLYQAYLYYLNTCTIAPITSAASTCTPVLFELITFTDTPTKDTLTAFNILYQTFHRLEMTMATALVQTGETMHLYLLFDTTLLYEEATLFITNSFALYFPLAVLKPVDCEAVTDTLSTIFSTSVYHAITQLSAVPTALTPDATPSLTSFEKQFKGKDWTLFWLASPMPYANLLTYRNQITTYYSQLSAYNQVASRYHKTHTEVVGNTCGDSNSSSCTNGCTASNTLTDTTTTQNSRSHNTNANPKLIENIPTSIARNTSESTTLAHGTNESQSSSQNKQETIGNNQSRSTTVTDTCLTIKEYTEKNQGVSDLLKDFTTLLSYIDTLRVDTAFCLSGYLLTPTLPEGILSTTALSKWVTPTPTVLSTPFITGWEDTQPDYTLLLDCFMHLQIPVFSNPCANQLFTATRMCDCAGLATCIFPPTIP